MSAHDDLPDGWLKRYEAWMYRHRQRLLVWGFIGMFIVSLAAGLLAYQATRENRKRIDQSCATDEREHLNNVNRLKQTYMALDSPTQRAQLGQGLVRLIVTQLSQLEAAARTDQVPGYCDEPGVGLPEPDPEVPPRKDYSHLLAPSNDPG